jgi:hypothetical protein
MRFAHYNAVQELQAMARTAKRPADSDDRERIWWLIERLDPACADGCRLVQAMFLTDGEALWCCYGCGRRERRKPTLFQRILKAFL